MTCGRRRLAIATGLGLAAISVLSLTVACTSSTTRRRPGQPRRRNRTRPEPSATQAPPKGPLLDPFTGEPVKALGPVLAVKIDNIVYARPQTGLQSADIVYVIPVEGGLTRFMAVYSSHIRRSSGRCAAPGRATSTSCASSGGPPSPGRARPRTWCRSSSGRRSSTCTRLQVGGYYRDPDRVAPYNLYADTKQLLAEAKGASKASDIGFRFGALPAGGRPPRPIGEVPGRVLHLPLVGEGQALAGLDRRRAGHGHRRRAARRQHRDHPVHADLDVRFLEYGGRPPYAKSVGSGSAVILRNGKEYTVHWSRPTLESGTTYTLPNGQRMLFAPGQVWVVLAPDNHASYVNAAKV